MALIPKKTNFRLRFRNKIKTSKIAHHDFKQRKPYSIEGLSKFGHYRSDILNKKLGWAPHINHTPHDRNKHADFYKKIFDLASYPDKINQTRHKLETRMMLDETSDLNKDVKTTNRLLFGDFGFCALNHSTLSTKFIETAQLDISKLLKKKGRVWLRICCDTPITARPVETRMGKGKGAIHHWETKVRPNQMLFEFSGVSKPLMKIIYNKLCKKSGVKLKLIDATLQTRLNTNPAFLV